MRCLAGEAAVGTVGIATRYDELATIYRSAIILHAVITWTKALSDTA